MPPPLSTAHRTAATKGGGLGGLRGALCEPPTDSASSAAGMSRTHSTGHGWLRLLWEGGGHIFCDLPPPRRPPKVDLFLHRPRLSLLRAGVLLRTPPPPPPPPSMCRGAGPRETSLDGGRRWLGSGAARPTTVAQAAWTMAGGSSCLALPSARAQPSRDLTDGGHGWHYDGLEREAGRVGTDKPPPFRISVNFCFFSYYPLDLSGGTTATPGPHGTSGRPTTTSTRLGTGLDRDRKGWHNKPPPSLSFLFLFSTALCLYRMGVRDPGADNDDKRTSRLGSGS